MGSARSPAVAGTFYPDDPVALRRQVEQLLAEVPSRPLRPKALIAPHAGYNYSGPIAASAYAQIPPIASRIRRVVLLGPSHFVPLRGLALPGAAAFSTPLGEIEVDEAGVEAVRHLRQVRVLDEAHAREHSLEVHVPFLQVVLGSFLLVPLVVGNALAEETAEVLDALWGEEETLIVISSDLSHYHSYDAALVMDQDTRQAIEGLDGRMVDGEHACGCHPIRGLLLAARRRNLVVRTLDLRNSGDTAGDRRRVVGYGAWAFLEASP